ncbi:hypothetical protein E3J61_03015 [Candidatus Dependentiae bacterium]|nr:MAG: hypothetical protein E3J61_03015 [Candidatus Dependentiae bacterium]
MIRKIMLGAILVASTSALYSIDASTQTEPQTKSFISMQRVKKAIDQSARFIRKHQNSKETRIGGHTLKILGSIWAIAGCLKTMASLKRNHANATFMIALDREMEWKPSLLESIMRPKTSRFKLKIDTSGEWNLVKISRPPYEAIFAIGSYLIYDGCYGIYNELNPRKKKNDTATS